MKNAIKIFAPATLTNLCVGYDSLGVALESLGDDLIIGLSDDSGISFRKVSGNKGGTDRVKSQIEIALQAFLKKVNKEDQGLEIDIHKQVPVSSGIGSSSCVVAALFGANRLLKTGLSLKELLPFSVLPHSSAKQAHFAHAVPCMLGGMTSIMGIDTDDIQKIYSPKGLYFAVILPQSVSGGFRQKISERPISYQQAIGQSANYAGFTSAANCSDLQLMKRCMEDRIGHNAATAVYHPYADLKKIADEEGAIGFGMSGDGPTMFALCFNKLEAEKIIDRSVLLIDAKQTKLATWVSPLDFEGVRLY